MSSPPPPPPPPLSSTNSSQPASSYRPNESNSVETRRRDDRDDRDRRYSESRDRDRECRSSRDRDSRDSRYSKDSRDRGYYYSPSSSRYSSSSRNYDRDYSRREDSYSRRSRSPRRSPRDRRDAHSPSRFNFRPREEYDNIDPSAFSRFGFKPVKNREPSPQRPPYQPSAYSAPAPHTYSAPSYQPYTPAAPPVQNSYSYPHPPVSSAMPWRGNPAPVAPVPYGGPSNSYGYAPAPAPSYGGHQYGPRPPTGGYMPYAPASRPVDSFGSFSNLHRQDWSSANLIKFEKNFYREHELVKARSESDVRNYRERHSMSVFGSNVPKPIQSFEEGCFPDYITRMLSNQGFSSPTAIQAQVNQNNNYCMFYLFFRDGLWQCQDVTWLVLLQLVQERL